MLIFLVLIHFLTCLVFLVFSCLCFVWIKDCSRFSWHELALVWSIISHLICSIVIMLPDLWTTLLDFGYVKGFIINWSQIEIIMLWWIKFVRCHPQRYMIMLSDLVTLKSFIMKFTESHELVKFLVLYAHDIM